MAKQAQALAQRQEAMTNQESMQLVSALLRVACYHREWQLCRLPLHRHVGAAPAAAHPPSLAPLVPAPQ